MDMESLIREFGDSRYSSLEIASNDKKIVLKKKAGVVQAPAMESKVLASLASSPVENVAKGIITKRVGLFYPKVKSGDAVRSGDVIGHIKAMNIMHELKADQDGTVRALPVDSGHGVEYGDLVVELEG